MLARTPCLAWFVLLLCLARPFCGAQDLSPRAYTITPLHSNAVTLTYSFSDGNILFDGAVPITDSKGRINMEIFNYYHALSFFGRSANLVVVLPYAEGHFTGTAFGNETTVYRSGLMDSVYRFSVNLKGGRAMPMSEIVKWKQKTLIGASIKVVAPTGQYDGTKLINWGSNRWAFKPELGYSERWGHWVVDAYGGVWFFTKNPEYFSHNQFFPGTQVQTQSPIGAVEGHLSYDLKPRFWVSLDGNYWFGGKTSLNGVENELTVQRNSRIGATASFPITKRQSLKFSFSDGAYIRFGGNYRNVSAAWQYSWIGRPK